MSLGIPILELQEKVYFLKNQRHTNNIHGHKLLNPPPHTVTSSPAPPLPPAPTLPLSLLLFVLRPTSKQSPWSASY